jgi:predicted O-methyltransferase YrrM
MDDINPGSTLMHENGYVFSRDWFSRHIPTLTTLIEKYKPKNILEIGSHEGRSTSWLIEQCSKTAQAPISVTCIDPWQWPPPPEKPIPGSNMEVQVQSRFDINTKLAISRAVYQVRFKKMRMPSSQALAQLITEDAKFDFCYIDGSHMAHDVLSDAIMAFHVMSVGSTFVFDDYLWSSEPLETGNPLHSPKLAIDAFAHVFGKKVHQVSKLPIDQAYFRKFAE